MDAVFFASADPRSQLPPLRARIDRPAGVLFAPYIAWST
jgi:hypothetical protein